MEGGQAGAVVTPARIPALEGYRGWAILGIVTLHVLVGLDLILGKGGAAATLVGGTVGNVVDWFFIISGFALFQQVLRNEGELGDARRFYRRRFARIYPAFWLSLIVLLVAMAIYLPHGYTYPGLGEIAVQFSGLGWPARIFDGGLLTGFGVNGVIWFVSVILLFYVVFPLIARPYYRHPWLGLLGAALISIAWKESAAHMLGFWNSLQSDDSFKVVTQLIVVDQFPGWAFSFGAGMTAAWVFRRLTATRDGADLERTALRAAPFALAGLAVAIYLFGHRMVNVSGPVGPTVVRESPLIPIVWSAAVAAAMVVILIGPAWMRRPFELTAMRRLGDLAYGVFLIHEVLIVYLISLFPGWTTSPSTIEAVAFFAVVLGGAIAYAALSRRYVETPAASALGPS